MSNIKVDGTQSNSIRSRNGKLDSGITKLVQIHKFGSHSRDDIFGKVLKSKFSDAEKEILKIKLWCNFATHTMNTKGSIERRDPFIRFGLSISYLLSFLLSFLPSFQSSFLLSCLPSSLLSFPLSSLPSFLLSFPLSSLPSFLPSSLLLPVRLSLCLSFQASSTSWQWPQRPCFLLWSSFALSSLLQ